MRNIILATDLDETAGPLLTYTLKLANKLDAVLTIYHSYGRPQLSLANTTDEERAERVKNTMRKLVETHNQGLLEETHILFKPDVDYPGDGILNEVKEGDYDLLILGLRSPHDGREQFTRLTQRILREAETSVLAIPPSAKFVDLEEIVFATDLDQDDEVVLEQLQSFFQGVEAKLFVINVYEGDRDKEEARKVLKKWAQRYADQPNIHFEMMQGNFGNDIAGYVERRAGDMLVLQSRTKGIFKRVFGTSNVQDLGQTTQVPLLVMRGDAK